MSGERLQMAAEKLNLQAMELLLKAGADPAVKNWRGKTVRECLVNGKRANRLAAQKCLLLLDKHSNEPERELAARRLRERGVCAKSFIVSVQSLFCFSFD